MTITFELSEEQASRIENARRNGIPLDTLFRDFLAHLPYPTPRTEPGLTERSRALIFLLHEWNTEDNDLGRGRETELLQDGEQFSANLKANRVSFPVPESAFGVATSNVRPGLAHLI